MKNRIRIISDIYVLSIGLVTVIMMTAACFLGMLLISDPQNVADLNEIPYMQVLFIGCYLLFIIAVAVSAVPRACLLITLSKEEIRLKIPYKKAEVFSYREFPYIFHGSYFHGNIVGMGKSVDYIVFSRRWMSPGELNQINNLANSREAFKIRYSPKVFAKLCDILPSKTCFNLRSVFRE